MGVAVGTPGALAVAHGDGKLVWAATSFDKRNEILGRVMVGIAIAATGGSVALQQVENAGVADSNRPKPRP